VEHIRTKNVIRINAFKRTWKLKTTTEKEAKEWSDIIAKNALNPLKLPATSQEELTKEEKVVRNKSKRQIILDPREKWRYVGKKVKSKLSAVALDNVDMEGYLWKTGRVNQSFKKRYFILKIKPQLMYYFKRKPERNAEGVSRISPEGQISLIKSQARDSTQRDFSFELMTHDRIFVLSAYSAQDREAWKQAISKSSKIDEPEEEKPITTKVIKTPKDSGQHSPTIIQKGNDVAATTPQENSVQNENRKSGMPSSEAQNYTNFDGIDDNSDEAIQEDEDEDHVVPHDERQEQELTFPGDEETDTLLGTEESTKGIEEENSCCSCLIL